MAFGSAVVCIQAEHDCFAVQQFCLCVMMSSTISSVWFIVSDPMRVRLRMERSTSSSIIPSTAVTHLPYIARSEESRAVDTPDAIFSEQLGFAPSHIMPVRLAIMFFTELHTRL